MWTYEQESIIIHNCYLVLCVWCFVRHDKLLNVIRFSSNINTCYLSMCNYEGSARSRSWGIENRWSSEGWAILDFETGNKQWRGEATQKCIVSPLFSNFFLFFFAPSLLPHFPVLLFSKFCSGPACWTISRKWGINKSSKKHSSFLNEKADCKSETT